MGACSLSFSLGSLLGAPAQQPAKWVDSTIYFANKQPIKDGIRRAVRKARQQQAGAAQPLQWVILNLSPVTEIDVSGVHLLESLVEELHVGGVQLALANPSGQLLRLLRRAGLLDRLGVDNIFDNMHEAVQHARLAMAMGAAPADHWQAAAPA
ncbi:sulfate transporter -like [Micractinium conductrix]|uniref:Sulfate transporter -like n=1 Tax=Micractinium conductrix TaxID=554055 RepID=A0A2P6VHC7_9CHLO|nr:sulfate transporter -like [Micractinium conductrix]|eukprot:PSC73493.1 sulfate transporter -like [Micractinium conductrix]